MEHLTLWKRKTFLKPDPEDLTFFLNVYHDGDFLMGCLESLRKVYPESRLIVRSDGDLDPRICELAKTNGGEFEAGNRLYPIENGGQVMHEMFSCFFRRPTPYLFKIDPDTQVARPFRALPETRCLFGTLQRQRPLYSIQGGCIGITLDAARELYRSKILLRPELCQRPPPYAFSRYVIKTTVVDGLTCDDWLLGWACTELGIEMTDWPEILSEWRIAQKNEDRRYAITHPHKAVSPDVDIFPCALRHLE